jgi:hypothetical protein
MSTVVGANPRWAGFTPPRGTAPLWPYPTNALDSSTLGHKIQAAQPQTHNILPNLCASAPLTTIPRPSLSRFVCTLCGTVCGTGIGTADSTQTPANTGKT